MKHSGSGRVGRARCVFLHWGGWTRTTNIRINSATSLGHDETVQSAEAGTQVHEVARSSTSSSEESAEADDDGEASRGETPRQVRGRVPESLPSHVGADRQRCAGVVPGASLSARRVRPGKRLSGGAGAAPPSLGAHSHGAALKEGWREFLARYPWIWFCTFTFAQEVHPEAADKRFRVWASKLSRSLYGPRWHKKRSGVYWIRALEFQRRGVIHYHALIGGARVAKADERLARADRRLWEREWLEVGRGFARVEAPRCIGSVSGYCAKYVAKGGEIDLGGAFPDLSALPLIPEANDEPP